MNDLGMYEHPDVYTVKEHPEISRKYLNLRYGSQTSSEYLDIYLPEEGDGPFPIIMDIHGGGWIYGVKSSVRMFPVLEGLKRGYAVASLSYSLSGIAQFPLQIYEVKAAVRFLRANAPMYRVDADRIALWGLSSGAHLAALTGTTNNVQSLEGEALGNTGCSSQVQAVVALYAPINLASCQIEKERAFGYDTPEGRFLGADPLQCKQVVEQADPVSYLKGERDDVPPFFLQYGTADEVVSPKQGEYLRHALQPYLNPEQLYFEVLDGAEHADDRFRTVENTEKIYAFLDKNLKGGRYL